MFVHDDNDLFSKYERDAMQREYDKIRASIKGVVSENGLDKCNKAIEAYFEKYRHYSTFCQLKQALYLHSANIWRG